MPNLKALIGSRICHDLINPLGAIGNGVELLELSGTAPGPELSLITDAVENASARVRMMRLAFGEAAPDQMVARTEILQTLEAVAKGGRSSFSWNVPGDPARLDVRVALLAVMCVETALPMGGDVDITMELGNWTVFARHDRLNLDPALWVPMSKSAVPDPLTAAQVHFGLLPDMAAEAGRNLTLAHGADWVKINF